MIWLFETGPQVRRWIYIWVLGIYFIFLACPVIRRDAMKNIMEDIFQCVDETEGQIIWRAVMECHELVGLVWYCMDGKSDHKVAYTVI